MVKIDFVNAQEPAINDTNLNQMQLNIENAINAQVSGDTLPVACIVPFTSDTVPENWLLCDGSAVSRTDYALLFSTIGTTYGVGDGSTTFNLPNLKGRVAVGKDSTQTEFDTLGETGGEKTHTLTIDEMPSHNHTYDITANDGAEGWARNGNWNAYGQHTTGSTGGGQPHNILQPYQVTNYIIKARQSSGLVATVVDGLNSTSTTDALSANQGRVLNEKFNYSTTEKVVGTWIDGKPLYRKTFTYSSSTPVSGALDISNLDIDELFFNLNYSYYYWDTLADGTEVHRYYPLSILNVKSTESGAGIEGYNSAGVYANSSKTRIHFDVGGNVKITKYIVTIEYTKTTD